MATESELQKMTLVELRRMATEAGLKSITTLRKQALIDALTGISAPAPAVKSEPAPAPTAPVAEPPESAEKAEENPPLETVSPAPVQEDTTASDTTVAPSSPESSTQADINARRSRSSSAYSRSYSKPQQQQQSGYNRTPRTPRNYANNQPQQGRTNYSHPPQNNGNGYHNNHNDSNGEENTRRDSSAAREYGTSNPAVPEMLNTGECGEAEGILDIQPDGYGFLRATRDDQKDVYISIAQIRRFNLRQGDLVLGRTRPERENERYLAMLYITSVNGLSPEEAAQRQHFDSLTPIFPDKRMTLELKDHPTDLAIRLIDLVAPIGFGQRGLIVSPPKAGKTTLLKKIASSISQNSPDAKLIVLLIDERPEEVTDMQRSTQGEVMFSTFDERPENHCRVAESVLERAKRMVEHGSDVVILLDSITRLARAYNLTVPPSGRSLSGGLDPGALFKPKRFFGAARNIEESGSLTIIATALVDTGSRMDDIIYEEFKGTGNMEIHLDRKLQERRVFPAIDLYRSGTRREELLLSPKEMEGIWAARKLLSGNQEDATELLIDMMSKTESNIAFLSKLTDWLKLMDKEGFTARKS